MGRFTPNETLIYESPDNGETIYAREAGTTNRYLVKLSEVKLEKLKELEQIELWKDILKETENNASLKTAVEHCILIYNLSKHHGI